MTYAPHNTKTVAEGSVAPGGRQPMTRAEAARHASLVRWKKEQPLAKPATSPDIQARVKQILAEKAKKKGPKVAKPKGGKGKGGAAKPKDARTSQEKANQNRAAVAKQGGMGDLEGTLVRLNAGMQGAGMENDKHDALIKKGLAERGPDGKTRLSAAGKKWKRAADKGDAEGASAALAEGADRAGKQAEKAKAKTDKAAERESKKQAAAKQKQAKAGSAKEKAKAKAQAAMQRKQEQDKKKAEGAQVAKEKAAERAAAPAKKQAENRAKVAKDMADQDAGLAPAGAAALSDFADGKPLNDQAAGSLTEMGLVEKDDQGGHRLTSEGRAAASAMNKGDTRAALDAISRAGEKKRKVAKPTKALEDIAMLRARQRLDAIKGLVDPPIFSLLNAQITRERYAEAAYTAIATWADSQSFPGLQAWATAAAAEERVHAQSQIDYLNDRGTVALEPLDAPPVTYTNYAGVLQGALDLEKSVTEALTTIVYRARSSGDEATALFIGGFLPEQVKAEKELQTYIQRVTRGAPIDLLDAELYEGAA